MSDFSVFHSVADNGEHFIDPDTVSHESEDYLKGVEAGKAEARSVYESTIQVMEQTLEALKNSYSHQVEAAQQSHSRVIAKCLGAVLPEAAKQILLSEMQNTIEKAANSEIRGQLKVKLNPENVTAKNFLQKKGAANIQIIETDEVGQTAVSFMWDKSRIDIDPEAAARTCLTLLSSYTGLDLSPEISTDPTETTKEEAQT